ncbi:ATP-binding protein [Actinocorallia populi]|uniref:ATP-binding protein n=1 Tax=Actinocorallia populi TaxID=2079200 RepID=UPI0013005A0D|nr:ATP-binding protein [Actinocorallia populi]
MRFAASPASVGSARRLVRARLPSWGLEDLVDACALVVSECATNSVRATEGDGESAFVVVRLRLTPTQLFAEIDDASPAPPVTRRAGEDAEDGRGLFLVAEYADQWGWYPTTGGKRVYAAWNLC